MNPYRNLPDHCFWSRAVTWAPPGALDPMIGQFRLHPQEPVATLGSCFAQHLARHIAKVGLNYLVAEAAPPEMPEAEAQRRNFGVFSARYGNVYTVRQAVQLFDRAFGSFMPVEDVWAGPNGDGFVDAFRPQIEPAPFGTADAVRTAAAEHLAQVRRVFTESRWLVFTLGLTEAWRSKRDGAIYPTAPGVAGGDFDPGLHEFVNFTAAEVTVDLHDFIARLGRVNPACQVILTVSPVPLIATWEPRHVLVSTNLSKAALRVAADDAERRHRNVVYFPSYDIITSNAHEGRYWADDLRQVTDEGVAHVMRVFTQHFLGGAQAQQGWDRPSAAPVVTGSPVVCDEEIIETALRSAGFKG
jgi:hypothetical protein